MYNLDFNFLNIATILLFAFGLGTLALRNVDGVSKKPSAFWALGGITAILVAFFLRFTSHDHGFLGNLFTLLLDLGTALSIVGVGMWIARLRGRKFLMPGLVLLGIFFAVFFGIKKWQWFQENLRQNAVASESAEQILIELGEDDNIEEVQAVLAKRNATAVRAFQHITMEEDPDLAQCFLVTCPKGHSKALMEELLQDKENVDAAEYNQAIQAIPLVGNNVEAKATNLTNDPQVNSQWAIQALEVPYTILSALKPSKKAKVAIIDTGVDETHEDIQGAFTDSPGRADGNGHGTHCAGLAGAVTNNQIGVASLNWEGKFIEIAGYKALSDQGGGTLESVVKAITQAAEDGADVISLSLGSYSPVPPRFEVKAIQYARKLGAIVVAAAGNSSEDAIDFAPANIPGVISVAAVDSKLEKASFSNTNSSLEMPLSAPGVDILSLKTGGGYVSYSGTSMATPIVSGAIGVLRALNPKITAEEAYQILKVHDSERYTSQGIGPLLQLKKAFELNP